MGNIMSSSPRMRGFKHLHPGMHIAMLLALFFACGGVHVSFAAEEVEYVNREYVISTDDVIEVTVFGEPDLSITTRISRDGTINYPLLNNIKVSALTARQLEAYIAGLLRKDYLVDPQVNVVIKEYSKISILGEVKLPGSYQLKERMTLTQALALAGGFTQEADLSSIQIMRTATNKKETLTVDLDKIMSKVEPDIEVRPQDTIIVGEFGNFSVVGQVTKPGIYKLKKNLGVVDAIGIAGGFTATASPDGTKVIRVENGVKKVIVVPVARIMKGAGTDVVLRTDDTLVVPESFF